MTSMSMSKNASIDTVAYLSGVYTVVTLSPVTVFCVDDVYTYISVTYVSNLDIFALPIDALAVISFSYSCICFCCATNMSLLFDDLTV